MHWLRSWLLWLVASVPSIGVVEIAAAMLEQVIHGVEHDPLSNEDLVRIGMKATEQYEKLMLKDIVKSGKG